MGTQFYERPPELNFLPNFDAEIYTYRYVYDIVNRNHIPTIPLVHSIHRKLGFHMVAGPGSGKSRFLGRYHAFHDFSLGIPTVIFDTGDAIDNFLDRVLRSLDWEYQKRDSPAMSDECRKEAKETIKDTFNRIVYVNMAGKDGRVIHFPLYRRFGNESTAEVAERFVELIRRITPELQTASVEGFPALERIANFAGQILITLDCQVTDMYDLLVNIDAWQPRIKKALEIDPGIAEAAEFFRPKNPAGYRLNRSETLLTQLAKLTNDPTIKAMLGANTYSIDWQRVIDKRQIVLFDFRDIRRREEKYRLLFQATFRDLMDFAQYRGANFDQPISVIADEFAGMFLAPTPMAQEQMKKDVQFWLNEIMRRHNVNFTLAHQDLDQFPPAVQTLLLGMGGQVIGQVSDISQALQIARQFFKVDPLKIKRTKERIEPVTYPTKDGYVIEVNDLIGAREYITKEDPTDYPFVEQHYKHAYEVMKTKPLEFLFWFKGISAYKERPSSYPIYWYEPGIYVDTKMVQALKNMLWPVYSEEIATILERIKRRLNIDPPAPPSTPEQSTPPPDRPPPPPPQGKKIVMPKKPPL